MNPNPYSTETEKYLQFTRKYCYREDGEPGCGVDIGSGGVPVVPWAWQYELPPDAYSLYNSEHDYRGPIQMYGHCANGCANVNSLDFVYSSHLLEDFADWTPILWTWTAMLKPGGYLIIMLPDKERWKAALDRGQPPNDAHRHEAYVGELTEYAQKLGLHVIEDRLTNLTPEDYNILFVAQKPNAVQQA